MAFSIDCAILTFLLTSQTLSDVSTVNKGTIFLRNCDKSFTWKSDQHVLLQKWSITERRGLRIFVKTIWNTKTGVPGPKEVDPS